MDIFQDFLSSLDLTIAIYLNLSFSFSFYLIYLIKMKRSCLPDSESDPISKAFLFCNSSNSLILKDTFLFLINFLYAASILSPVMNLEGLASVALAICDFFICNSIYFPQVEPLVLCYQYLVFLLLKYHLPFCR